MIRNWRKSSYSGGSGTGNCVEVSWRKSSYSGSSGTGNCVEVNWRKSSHSSGTGNGNCVEIAFAASRVGVRDSKNVLGPVLEFSPVAWRAFARDVA